MLSIHTYIAQRKVWALILYPISDIDWTVGKYALGSPFLFAENVGSICDLCIIKKVFLDLKK